MGPRLLQFGELVQKVFLVFQGCRCTDHTFSDRQMLCCISYSFLQGLSECPVVVSARPARPTVLESRASPIARYEVSLDADLALLAFLSSYRCRGPSQWS